MKVNPCKVSKLPTIRRLPAYLHLLQTLRAEAWKFVSTTVIAETLELEPIQVRKDLSLTGIVGKPRVGYAIPALIDAIETYLGWNATTEAILVGAGHLGTALLGYKGFAQHGLHVVAVFDNDPAKVGQKVHGLTVLPMEQVAELVARLQTPVGIITVPPHAAQEAADTLIAAGITGIWNFSPVTLHVPEGVVVQNEDLSSGLAVLSRKMADPARHNHQ